MEVGWGAMEGPEQRVARFNGCRCRRPARLMREKPLPSSHPHTLSLLSLLTHSDDNIPLSDGGSDTGGEVREREKWREEGEETTEDGWRG